MECGRAGEAENMHRVSENLIIIAESLSAIDVPNYQKRLIKRTVNFYTPKVAKALKETVDYKMPKKIYADALIATRPYM